MITKKTIDGIELTLTQPDEIPSLQWIGGAGNSTYMNQLLAAWLVLNPESDLPMNPQILGKPGVGKTTLAYCAAKKMNGDGPLPVYIFQCTVDTRPDDLLISPVIGKNNTIKYHASGLVSAMITGGICILDEANRMSEKSWASLAALLDQRRYIESIITGLKIHAHPNFRICATLNDDTSTFEIPEYIHSRLQPQIFLEFPDRDEEFQILQFNLPYAPKQILNYTVNFLQNAHSHNQNYTSRDGINIARYYLKLEQFSRDSDQGPTPSESPTSTSDSEEMVNPLLFRHTLRHILGKDAAAFLSQSKKQAKEEFSESYRNVMESIDSGFFNENQADEDNIEEERDDLFYIDEQDPYSSGATSDSGADPDEDVIHISDPSVTKDARREMEENAAFNDIFADLESKDPQSDPNDIIRDFFMQKYKKQDSSKKNKKQEKKEPKEKKPQKTESDLPDADTASSSDDNQKSHDPEEPRDTD
jgi:hypothetical protein